MPATRRRPLSACRMSEPQPILALRPARLTRSADQLSELRRLLAPVPSGNPGHPSRRDRLPQVASLRLHPSESLLMMIRRRQSMTGGVLPQIPRVRPLPRMAGRGGGKGFGKGCANGGKVFKEMPLHLGALCRIVAHFASGFGFAEIPLFSMLSAYLQGLVPPGIEPGPTASEAIVLSIGPRDHCALLRRDGR
ncbi:MAG: hypothetical protein RLZZ522_2178 [Verrucomicrobiota bacterium]